MSNIILPLTLNDGTISQHRLVSMASDGSCLLHALCYAMHNKIDHAVAFNIRSEIVSYIVKQWRQLQIYTCNEKGLPYHNAESYSCAMLCSSTYGSVSELMGAASLYPFTFEVYENGELRGCFKNDFGGPIKRLLFSGNFLSGHYDFLLPLNGTHILNNKIDFSVNNSNSDVIYNNKKRGRPIKKKRGRQKNLKKSRSEQMRQT